jgi:hypothetical protein
MAEVAIRAPSVGALFDAWSPEPLSTRPLGDEARERIVDAWAKARKEEEAPPTSLLLILPAGERREGLDEEILAALRLDVETMRTGARRRWIRRALAPRETRIGIAIFFCSMLAAAAVELGSSDDSLESLLAQTFVVLAWVALWGPAYGLMTAASFRLGRRYFAELAEAEISIRWD